MNVREREMKCVSERGESLNLRVVYFIIIIIARTSVLKGKGLKH